MTYQTWTSGDIEVCYTPELDGDGSSMAPLFVDYLKANYANRLPFACAFEWCAGPGFIGFALLAEKVCRRLVLADINSKALDAARATVYNNALDDRVAIYHGDNLAAVPASEKFDLVVGNPPNFFCLNPAHPAYARLKGDLRPNDPDWRLHRAFYQTIPSFLSDDAILCIEEVDPYATKCYMPNAGMEDPLWGPEPFDIRARPPIEDFVPMISQAGLEYIATERLPHPSVPVHLMVSRWDGADRALSRLRSVQGLSFCVSLGANTAGQRAILAVQGDRVKGSLKFSPADPWIPRLFEILAQSGGRQLLLSDLAEQLNVGPKVIHEIVRGLRKNGWVT